MNWHDRRFATDPTFPLLVANQTIRRTCLSIGNVMAKGSINTMTMEELQKKVLEENDMEVLNQMRYFSKSIEGSGENYVSDILFITLKIDL